MTDHLSVTAGTTTFQWLLVDEDTQRIGLLLRTDPSHGTEAVRDMTTLVEMLTAAELEPEFEAQHVRLDKNGAPTVTVTWIGQVNNLEDARTVLVRMSDNWRVG